MMEHTPAARPDDDRTPLALAAGLAAALLGGGIWAAIVLITDMEIGWAAWGIGLLVGLAMARTTANRSRGLALAAAALAAVGLVAGKTLVMVGGIGSIADHVLESPETMNGLAAWRMYEEGRLDPATVAAIEEAESAGDTLSDALWASMLGEAGAWLETLSDDERRALATETARAYVGQLGVVGGLALQFSGFDLLWLLLAVGTAFQMMAARPEEEAPVVATSGSEGEPEPAESSRQHEEAAGDWRG